MIHTGLLASGSAPTLPRNRYFNDGCDVALAVSRGTTLTFITGSHGQLLQTGGAIVTRADGVAGSMYGAAIGDALGSAFEFVDAATIQQTLGEPFVWEYWPALPGPAH